MRKLWALALLLASTALGQITLSDVSLSDVTVGQAAGGGGCNEFTDDLSSDPSASWTDDGGWAWDDPNDEYDFAGGGDSSKQLHDTTTTDENQCALMQVSAPSLGVVLRGSFTNSDSFYVFEMYYGSWRVNKWTNDSYGDPARDTQGWSSGEGGHDDTDDWIALCVDGTSTSTSFEAWFWDDSSAEAPTGPCPSDWGTANASTTDCSTWCVDATDQKLVGVMGKGGDASSLTYLAGSDND